MSAKLTELDPKAADASSPDDAPPRSNRRFTSPRGLLILCGLAAVLGGVGFVSARVDLNAANSGPANPRSYLPQVPRHSEAAPDLLTTQLDASTPEGQLIQSYQHLARGEEAKALQSVERLVQRQPNFALAQLLYGDLLLARTGQGQPRGVLSNETAASAAASTDPAAGLRAEARLRLSALIERPPQDALPKELLSLAPAVKHAVVVDTSRARLYLFENSAQGLRLVRDVYVSIGKLGTGKLSEGDLRTPLGTYHVGLRRDEAAERYGAAALPLNYPNEYDRVVGRGGSSIWLHGERAGNYARGPLSTDGCIVLSNDEMQKLADTVVPRETPVLITEHIEWVKKPPSAVPLNAGFEAAFQSWQTARMAQDVRTLRGLYEPGLQRGSDSETERLEHNLARMARGDLPVQNLERLSALPWQDQQAVVIVTYREFSGADPKAKLKRQYWREQDGQWRILFDGLIG